MDYIGYDQWIQNNIPENSIGLCAALSLEMQKVFPELERVRGHYVCPFWGNREHWWLVTSDGTIVDPTVEQFPSKGLGDYIEWEEGASEPTGECYNCGDYTFNDESFCSSTCEQTTILDLMA